MSRLLARSDLVHPPEVWLPKLQAAMRARRDLLTLPELVRDVGLVLVLDAEVRGGGFALFFFNPSCRHVFETWFALEALDPTCVELMTDALARVGLSYGIDLDVRALAEMEGDVLRPAYGRLIDIVTCARNESGTLLEKFARFQNRLAADQDGLEGLASLDARWCAYEDWKEPVIERILANRLEFMD